MSQYVGEIPLGDTVPFPFDTYNSSGGSVTITGLAVTDIEVFKDGSITQRSSDNGYALLDTDGIDFDSRTGLHGFSIDTSDNSDSGFYAAGSYYWVHVDAITVDSQTVRFTFWFRMVAAENVAGVKPSDVTHFGGSAGTFASGRPEVNTSHLGGTSQTGRDIGASVLLSPGTGTGQILLSSGKVDAYAINGETQTGVDLGLALIQLLPQFGNAVGATGNTTTTVHINGIATYGNDEIVDHLLIIYDGSTGESHSRWITAFNGTTDVATVATLPFTPQATVDLWTLTNIRRNTKPESLGTQAKADVNAEADTALSDYDPPTRTEATADKDAIIAQGDAAWATATGFSTHSAADVMNAVWSEDPRNWTTLFQFGNYVKTLTDAATGGSGFTALGVGQTVIASRLPTALVGGRMDSTVDGTGMEAGAVTAIQSGLATAAALSTTDGKVDQILADTGTDGVVVASGSKTGYALSSTGLDQISAATPNGVASTFATKLMQVWARLFGRVTRDSDEIKTYRGDGTTVATTQTYTASGSDEDVGAAS